MPKVLSKVPLFANLSEAQLYWLREQVIELSLKPGDHLAKEGEPAGNFYVLLEGEIELTKKVGDADRYVMTFASGMFFGHELILLGSPYLGSARALTESHLFVLETDAFWQMLTACPSITRDLLVITAQRLQTLESMSRHHEKLIALGTLAAGLAHELNNPTAAVSRGSKQLQELFQRLPSLALKLNQQQMKTEQMAFLADLHCIAAERTPKAPQFASISQQRDREDEVTNWLESHGIADGWQLAPTLVEAGLEIQWLDTLVDHVVDDSLADVLNWIEATLTGFEVLYEIRQSATRIFDLVKAVKEYSYMDQAPRQQVDVHDGLESTLTILGHKLKGGVVVTREYDRSLPHIGAYGSELNQVWTNLIDNAIDAMDGRGQIWIRTSLENECVLVEIADNGPGIPREIQRRIFEPFFTTKGVGKGTGLGLVISYRIIVEQHKGDIRVFSQPGDTRLQVHLPITLS